MVVKEKLKWVDIVKGFAIIAVVMWHTQYDIANALPYGMGAYLPLRQLLGTFWHVPVFLCIGGFFLKEDELVCPKRFILKKWKQLYVKLLLFYALFIIFHNFFFHIGFYSEQTLYNGKYIAPLLTSKDYAIACMWALVAAREPLLGAMWFVNLLFLGLCVISLVSYVLSKTRWKTNEYARAVVILVLFVFSCFLSHVVGISITRLTPALCGAWLIYCGFLINKKHKVLFDNVYVFLASLFLMYQMCSIYGDVSMADDIYGDCVILTAGTICSLYVLCFIAKKIESTIFGKFVALCGSESYYIMALHLLGFKIGTMILLSLGINKSWNILMSPASSLIEWLLYIISGVAFSLIVAFVVSKLQSLFHSKFYSN